MNQNTSAPVRCAGKKLTTKEAADKLRAGHKTPTVSLSRLGHWMGMRPVKLPNGRLLWDAAEVERLASGNAA